MRQRLPSVRKGSGLRFSLLACKLLLGVFFCLVCHLPSTALTTGSNTTLKVMTLNWVSDGQSYLASPTLRSMQAIFPMAMRDFNNRDGRIIPEFATLTECEVIMDTTNFVDDHGLGSTAVHALVSAVGRNEVDVVLGPVRSAVASSLVVTATALGIPVISHFATQPALTNKADIGSFSRTCATDDTQAYVTAKLMSNFGYGRVGMVYVDDAFGTAWNLAFEKACNQFDIRFLSKSYKDALRQTELIDSLTFGLASLKEANINIIIIVIISTEHYIPLARAAKNLGMLTENNMYITTIQNPLALAISNPENATLLNDFFRGSLNLLTGIPGLRNNYPNPAYHALTRAYLDSWNIDDLNSYFPKTVLNNRTMHLTNSDLVEYLNTGQSGGWGWAYDAVAAVGLAACKDPSARKTDLLSNIRQQSFVGASGLVKFTHWGDRDPSTATQILINFQFDETNSLIPVPVGVWPPAATNWTLELKGKVKYRDGTDVPPPFENQAIEEKNLLPEWAKILGYVECSIVVIFSMYCSFWMQLNRKTRLIVAFQPAFMHITTFGSALMGFSIIPLTMEFDDVACMSFPWCIGMGVALVMAAIFAKSWRVARLWLNPGLPPYVVDVGPANNERPGPGSRDFGGREVREPGRYYLWVVFVLVFVQFALLLAWTLVAPLEYVRVAKFVSSAGIVLSSYGVCSARTTASLALMWSVLAFLGAIVAAAVVASVRASAAPSSFQDSKSTLIAAAVLAQFLVFGILLVAVVSDQPVARFLVLSCLAFLTPLALLCSLFLTKMYILREMAFGRYSSSSSPPVHSQIDVNYYVSRTRAGRAKPPTATSVRTPIWAIHRLFQSSDKPSPRDGAPQVDKRDAQRYETDGDDNPSIIRSEHQLNGENVGAGTKSILRHSGSFAKGQYESNLSEEPPPVLAFRINQRGASQQPLGSIREEDSNLATPASSSVGHAAFRIEASPLFRTITHGSAGLTDPANSGSAEGLPPKMATNSRSTQQSSVALSDPQPASKSGPAANELANI